MGSATALLAWLLARMHMPAAFAAERQQFRVRRKPRHALDQRHGVAAALALRWGGGLITVHLAKNRDMASSLN
jgi:hypothetical protein